MTSRLTVLAIEEAARAGDTETLTALLTRHEELMAGLSPDEAREACVILDSAQQALQVQMKEIQHELGHLHKKERGRKQYRTAA